jgi:hypothetical protein
MMVRMIKEKMMVIKNKTLRRIENNSWKET